MSEKRPQWLFNESKHAGVDYADKDLVHDYDRQHENFRDFEQEAQKIATALGLSKDSTVLDIGCGTGGLSIHFARICKYVSAVDVSKAMIEALKDKVESQGLDNVTPVQSGFLTYEHDGDAPDAIVANITLHHLPDFWKQIALCRLYDLLKPGGKMFLADVIFGFEPRSYREAINGWLQSMREFVGSKIAEETTVHIRDEFSTWEWVMSGMLDRAGFRIDNSFELMPQMRAYICSKV